MKNRIGWELLFICILGVTGWYLYGTFERIKTNNPELRRIENYNNMVFVSGAGIDIMGNKIESILTNKTDGKEIETKIDSPDLAVEHEKQQHIVTGDSSSKKANNSNKKGGVVAFLLRYDSLDADLKFWNEVNSCLSEPDIVRLTAYCENNRCIETIRKKPDMVRFTVFEYGEAVDVQAVIGADSTGEFWMRKNNAKKLRWRNEILAPCDVARSIEQ